MTPRYALLALPLMLAACSGAYAPMKVQPGAWPSQTTGIEYQTYQCADGKSYKVVRHGISNPAGHMAHLYYNGSRPTYIAPTYDGFWQPLPADPEADKLTLEKGRLSLRGANGKLLLSNCALVENRATSDRH